MRITYENLSEFADVVVRCENTVRKGMCHYCPLYDNCDVIALRDERNTIKDGAIKDPIIWLRRDEDENEPRSD